MADKSIRELTAATSVGSTDLFVLEQSNVAKKLTGQILENWLLELAEAHGGISTITKTSTSGLVDTYTITYSDETTTTFTVTNGKGISSVAKTAAVSPSLTDTYTITYTDSSTYAFTVDNGKGISSIAKTSTSGLTDTYTITYNDGTTSTFAVTNGKAISSITEYWARSSSNSTTPSSWSTTVPTLTSTYKYLWHYQTITYNNSTTASTTKAVVGVYGDTGAAWYVWIKYSADEPTSDSDMTDNPSKWIGVYSGTTSSAPSTYTSYTWSQLTGDTGNGISSIAKTGTSGLEDTYTITMTDSTTYSFTVTNGKSISTIALTSTSGLIDTYTITFNDSSTTTFTVTNGRSVSSIEKTSTSGLVDTYTVTYNDSTTSTFTVTNGRSVSSVAYVSSSGLTDTYRITYNDSTTSTFTVTNGKSISTIANTSSTGLVDTYTITFNDNTTSTFTVTNGSSIESISKTSTSGLVDTYTITQDDGTTSTFTVTNAKSISSIALTSGTHAAGTTDVYTITFNDGDTQTFSVYNGANGTGAVSTVAGIGVSDSNGDVPLILWGNGAPTTSTTGELKQLYFDLSGGIMYICVGVSGTTYTWSSMGITVDSTFSTTSSNPVMNSTISNKIGTGSLSGFTATDLTAALNEVKADETDIGLFYGTCSTAAATQAKTVTISGITSLAAGLKIAVIFTYGQTYSGTPTLNVNSLGAKSIYRMNSTAAAQYEWQAGETLIFVYNGSQWVIVDGGIATTTYYGVTKLSSSTSSSSTEMAATPSAVKAAYDLADGKPDLESSTTPVMDGTASVGSATTASASDHVHPTDTTRAPLASPAFTGTPTAPTATSSTNSTQIATTAYVKSLTGTATLDTTAQTLNGAVNELKSALDNEILYYTSQTVSVASSAQIMRIPSSGTDPAITTDTVVLECTFTNPAYITTNVDWTSYDGYIAFTGTCTTATTANVTLGTKGN